MIKESIKMQVGGEFGIGGLFDCEVNGIVQRKVYREFKQLAPSLKVAFTLLEQQPPILHAALIADAPQHVLTDIIKQFDCIFTKDSFNRLPIDVASELQCYEKSGEIIKEMAKNHKCPLVYIVAQYGLKWGKYMVDLVETNIEEVINGHDGLTNLRLFMIAAMGNCSDLSSIYGIMRMSPEKIN